MRTAEEILNDHFKIFIGSNKFIIAAMKEYAIEACKEQRKLCEKAGMKSNIHDVDKNILNAPLPELK